MTENKIPANNNASFSNILENKPRKLTDNALGSTLELLKQADIPNSVVAEALFSCLKASAMPSKNASHADNMVWYAQLQRFRSDLDMQIHIIESTLDETHQ